MPRPAPQFTTIWPAHPLVGPVAKIPAATLSDVGPDWRELGQAWRTEPELGFNAGWARIRWNAAGLLFESVFLQRQPANRARSLNEPTWEMGDISEFFLQEPRTGRYIELHVTPENQRLQLLWPLGGLDRFRAGTAALSEFLVTDPDWVQSSATIAADHWTARAFVPFTHLGLREGEMPSGWRTAVCRYDRSLGPELLSSTARLAQPNYHRHAEWSELRLEPGP